MRPRSPAPGNQDALQSDARAPSPLQELAHRFARAVGEQDVQHEEERPHDLRHFVRAARLGFVRRVVHLDVQRGYDTEHDGEDGADQHGEKVVHARSAAAQAIDALKLKGERRQHRDERQHVHVLFERRIAVRHRDEAAFETDAVGEDERPHRQNDVRDDVAGDEQAVVASYHRDPAGALIVSSITSRMRWR